MRLIRNQIAMSRCRVLPEKLTGFQLFKKFSAFFFFWNPKFRYRINKNQ